MYLIIKKVCFLVGLTLWVIVNSYGQIVTSIKHGLWTDPTVWDSNLVPTVVNSTETVVNHEVMIPAGSTISLQNVVVNGRLTVGTGSVADLVADALPEKKDLQVFGVLVQQDGATLNGTTVSNTIFESGSRYIHLQGPLGFIPYATWDPNSTFEIGGFTSQGYINIAHSDSWKQNFGHVIYNCAQQTTAFVDLNGYLRNIAGNFTVLSTNNQALRLSTTQNPVISIGGDFTIEGPSKVWFSTTPSNTVINVQKDFLYHSTSTGISYLTTKGSITVNIHGEMEMNSPGRIHMASTSTDSTGTRQCTLSLFSDFKINAGTLIAPPAPGKGTIKFIGAAVQQVLSSASSFQGNLDFTIESTATVDLGTSVLSNSAGNFLLKGKLLVGSTDPEGAIQLTNKGNIQVRGERTYENGSTIEYNGGAEQWIGAGHPDAPGTNLICNNALGINLLKDIVVKGIRVGGKLLTYANAITAYGDVSVNETAEFNSGHLIMMGAEAQQLDAPGKTLMNLTINKSNNDVIVTNPLDILGSILIASPNTTLHTNGHVTLLSLSDEPSGTACVGLLPNGSSVEGNVTVQRHMEGEGRRYRFISSPVGNGTVASLKDDFPVTGKFLDPSTGPGIKSTSPSLYYYDESVGGLQEGWKPYPTTGLASDNPLIVGKGYAAFVRKANAATIWDVTGPLNQGTIDLPVNFTSNNEPSNGWNLMGNPYACAIQWREPSNDGWTMESISPVIAVYDNQKINGIYRYYDMDDNYLEIPDGRIASGQSVWVRATGPNPKLTIREGVKVLGGATFFRKEPARIPSFAIRLSKDSISDVAYFKVRPFSKPALDEWDGLKLDNDNYDLSFLSSDKMSLAINATNKMPCDTVVQIHLKDLTVGSYQFSLTTKYDFSRYDYTLIDKFLQSETLLSHNQPVEFVVTKDPASFAVDRISLRLAERKPRVDLSILGPASVCEGDMVDISIKNAEEDVRYSLWDSSGRMLSSMKPTASSDLTIRFPSDSLHAGEHILTLKAESSCYVDTLQNSYQVKIQTEPRVFVFPDSVDVCRGTSAKFAASSDGNDVFFNWFPELDSQDAQVQSTFFETPPLLKSRSYYVEAVTPSGCTSDRIPVKANVRTYEDAEITVTGDSALVSNYAINNTWFFNDNKIEPPSLHYTPLMQPGVYKLQVDTLGCTSTDIYEYIPLHIDEPVQELAVYPNPVREFLFIRGDIQADVKRIQIFNSQGLLVMESSGEEMQTGTTEDYQIRVSPLSKGAYVAVIETLRGKRTFRFMK
ncbi:T9SS type A sorting domain-containing protein [Chryseolinea sp. H1M3-3]|uniref:Ig-like domain-containing protein n=1 Tax=Chryseolinea sp. H1M3-3 TaxID=3034144 RepID=UPI0023ECFE45|nr:T9SS type A sorting domain-containing protein [Chryseolinea sp. H1M3-3]